MDWSSATLPILDIAFKAPAYNDATRESAALDALSFLAFSNTSDLYQKLVVQEQKADMLASYSADHVDPSLFEIVARVKSPTDIDYVRDQVLAAIKTLQEKPVEAPRLDAVRKHLRYSVALRMDSSDSIASILAHYVALRRTPETMNRLYEQYAKITPEDVQQVALKYLVEKGRTMVMLTGSANPAGGGR